MDCQIFPSVGRWRSGGPAGSLEGRQRDAEKLRGLAGIDRKLEVREELPTRATGDREAKLMGRVGRPTHPEIDNFGSGVQPE